MVVFAPGFPPRLDQRGKLELPKVTCRHHVHAWLLVFGPQGARCALSENGRRHADVTVLPR